MSSKTLYGFRMQSEQFSGLCVGQQWFKLSRHKDQGPATIERWLERSTKLRLRPRLKTASTISRRSTSNSSAQSVSG